MEAPLHRQLGLTDEEAERICSILGRAPNRLELAMYAVMWSEHCSYKSSRAHLGRLPSEGPGVLAGPGENAGVVELGDGMAVAVRIESHNHPSAVEPRQGAATGVGGIVRDVLAVGARPMALLDSLRFGPLEDARNRYLLEGVVFGISAYGNSVGVPTVGGELELAEGFSANPLVNVMCLGLLPTWRLVRARASGVGNLAVLLGATTGRDGIGGVSVLASSGFGPSSGQEMRPSVQVGDPFEEKRLIEACLELLDRRLIVGLQDLGGAGLTCAASETAARAGLGMDLDLSAVPLREPGMEPFEVMTSESQERMLAIVAPADLEQVLSVCRRWEVSAAVVGRVTAPAGGVGRLRVLERPGGRVLADVPAASLSEAAPCYDRPASPPSPRRRQRSRSQPAGPEELKAALLDLLGTPDLADRSWVASQYDHQLFLNTVVGPGGDAAVLRLSAPGQGQGQGALAVSVDGNSRWCSLDPRVGTQMVLAEATLNVACCGARPIAVVDCLNLGNPEHPTVMWQLAQVIDGLAEGCRALGLPVVGGNVSLYNETAGQDISPTPVVGVVGLIEHLERPPSRPALVEAQDVVVLGPPAGSLAGSRRAGAAGAEQLAEVDFACHHRVLELVAELCRPARGPAVVAGVHDVSDGGLGLALAEMALASGVGLRARLPEGDPEAQLFSESASRVVLSTPVADEVVSRAVQAEVPAFVLGRAGGDRLVFDGLFELGLDEAAARWAGGLSCWFDP